MPAHKWPVGQMFMDLSKSLLMWFIIILFLKIDIIDLS